MPSTKNTTAAATATSESEISEGYIMTDHNPAMFSTLDWQFTLLAFNAFITDCRNKLSVKQGQGYSHFMDLTEYELRERLLDSFSKESYTCVANYAMMLHTQRRDLKEQAKAKKTYEDFKKSPADQSTD